MPVTFLIISADAQSLIDVEFGKLSILLGLHDVRVDGRGAQEEVAAKVPLEGRVRVLAATLPRLYIILLQLNVPQGCQGLLTLHLPLSDVCRRV